METVTVAAANVLVQSSVVPLVARQHVQITWVSVKHVQLERNRVAVTIDHLDTGEAQIIRIAPRGNEV